LKYDHADVRRHVDGRGNPDLLHQHDNAVSFHVDDFQHFNGLVVENWFL
jgi:hypothetical protein